MVRQVARTPRATSLALALVGASSTSCAMLAPKQIPVPTFHGTVRDENGAPLAGATVILCGAGAYAVNDLVRDFMWAGMAAVMHAMASSEGGCRATTTADDGRWKAEGRYAKLMAIATGRAFVLNDSIWKDSMAKPIAISLVPDAPLRVVVRYDGPPCESAALGVHVSRPYFGAATFEGPDFPLSRDSSYTLGGLAPGEWTITAWSGRDQPGERRAQRTVTLAGRATILLELQPTGTGKSVSGTGRYGEQVDVVCSSVHRRVRVEPDGTFTAEDVGPGPCELVVGDCREGRVSDVLPGATNLALVSCPPLPPPDPGLPASSPR